VCGYKVGPNRPPGAISGSMPKIVERPRSPSQGGQLKAPVLAGPPAPHASDGARGAASAAAKPAREPLQVQAQKARAVAKPKAKTGDEIYIDQVLNNRFKVESKIGEGGFGAVYRGVQLATGRKVALKLLHPEMTKDENLVARFRREGMVLCNLRDAHTITTYDFDQTPDGTLYIAMELLEGKSLHQLFHLEAPLDWKRVFKILTEMCSSLAEAHAQGIVHRDLKPENIYLETRPGNPEFVKILDFGIAKVMRGDSIDPQSPQLTATGQTLGTLEYMSPEQLMGKPLDGRSDVYALGVLAYEMITGRLPFPEAKGPAGLITAQLKQTPLPPSQAYPKGGLPKSADRAILKCLEKDKNNRYPDVSALAVALQDVISNANSELSAIKQLQIPGAGQPAHAQVDMLETRRGEMPNMAPPPLPMGGSTLPGMPGDHGERGSGLSAMPPAMAPTAFPPRPMTPTPPPPYGPPPGLHNGPHNAPRMQGGGGAMLTPMPSYAPPGSYPHLPQQRSSRRLVWWVIALLAIGAGVGTAMALLFSK
jgi:eukaryotic-like serine/threonine-protein kinase